MSVLSIDVGSTSIKMLLVVKNKVIKTITLPITTYNEQSGAVFQKTTELLSLIESGIQSLQQLTDPIDQIVLGTAMHSLIPSYTNKESNQVYLWSDYQSNQTIKEFKKNEIALTALFYEKTGTPIHPMSPFAKIYHQKITNQDFKKVTKWLDLKSWLMYYFTGDYVLDYSLASATGLFNSQQFTWDREILDFLNITTSQLPKTVDTNAEFVIKKNVCQNLGLAKEARITIGASDGTLASFGAFKTTNCLINITLGTSGAVRILSKTRQLTKEQATFCYYLNQDYWVIGGPSNNGGKVLAWLADLLYETPGNLFLNLPKILTSTSIGANGVLFYPYINGERAPFWDNQMTGSFKKLQINHQKEDIVRSAIEGILFNLKEIYDMLAIQSEFITVNGGFFIDLELIQMTADIFGKTIFYSKLNEPIYGSLFLYLISQEEDLTRYEQNLEPIIPDMEKHMQYNLVYQKFLKNRD